MQQTPPFNLGRAIPLLRETLTDREQVMGPDHPDTLMSRNNLAYAYQAAGDLGQAIPLYKGTLTNSERVLGPEQPHVAAIRSRMNFPQSSADESSQ